MKIFSAASTPDLYELKVEIRFDNKLLDFLSSLKIGSMFVVDPELDEYTRAFYVRSVDFQLITIDSPEGEIPTLTFHGTPSALEFLARFIAYLGVAGNGGHSYVVESADGESFGWDGDGIDFVKSLTLYGKKMKIEDFYSFNKDAWLEYTFDELLKKADPVPRP